MSYEAQNGEEEASNEELTYAQVAQGRAFYTIYYNDLQKQQKIKEGEKKKRVRANETQEEKRMKQAYASMLTQDIDDEECDRSMGSMGGRWSSSSSSSRSTTTNSGGGKEGRGDTTDYSDYLCERCRSWGHCTRSCSNERR